MNDRTGNHLPRLKAGLWLAAAVVLGLATLLGSWLLPRVLRGVASHGWVATDGVLLETERGREVEVGIDHDTVHYWISLEYAYTAIGPDGRPTGFSGVHYDVDTGSGKENGGGPGSTGKVRFAARQAPELTVYYDPRQPADSVLRPGISYATGWWLLLVGWLAAAGVALVRVALRLRGPANSEALARARASAAEFGITAASAALLFAVGAPVLLASVSIAMEHWLHALPSAGWAIGLTVAGFALVALPEAFRPRPVRVALGFTAPIVALTVLAGMALTIQELASGEPRPNWVPTEQEQVARLSHPNPRVRVWACWAIGRARTPEPPPEVVAALVADDDPEVVDAAMFLLKQVHVRHPAIAAALTDRLDDESEETRQDAAWRLAGQQPDEAATGLAGAFALLRGGETSQRAGLTLLGQIGRGDAGAARAVAALVRDPSAPSRRQAIWTLELMKSDQDVALEAVFGVLAEGDEELRRTAVHYLAEVGRAVDRLPGAALEAIVLDLTHEEPRRRQDAARALARLGSGASQARAELEETAASDQDALTRHLAAEALAALPQV